MIDPASHIIYQTFTGAATAIFPWSVANRAGRFDVVYYGTSYYDATNPPDSYPMSATWYVYSEFSNDGSLIASRLPSFYSP